MVNSSEEVAIVVGTSRMAVDLYSRQIAERIPVRQITISSTIHWPSPSIKESIHLIKLLRGDWSLLHLPNQFQSRYGNFINSPFIVTIHDLIRHHNVSSTYVSSPKEKLFVELDKRGFKKAKHIIAISNSTKNDIVKFLGIPAEKISVVYQGVDHQIYYPRKRDEQSNEYILFVGSDDPRKNFITLLEAFSIVKKDSRFKSLKVVQTGFSRDGTARNATLEAIDRLHLTDDIIFPDFWGEDELAKYYSNAVCFVLPSLYEGFGLPPLEAMACGCPVITSNVSSLPEVVGDAGILVDPEDPNRLAEEIVRVLTDNELKNSMIEKGLSRAKEFTWQKTAEETLQVYNKVLNG